MKDDQGNQEPFVKEYLCEISKVKHKLNYRTGNFIKFMTGLTKNANPQKKDKGN